MTEEEIRLLLATEQWYGEQAEGVKKSTVALILLLMMGMGSWRDRDWEKVTPEVTRVLQAGAVEVSTITLSRIHAMRELQGVGIKAESKPLLAADATAKAFIASTGNGLSKIANEVYSRLADKKGLEIALSRGGVRLEKATTNSLQNSVIATQQFAVPRSIMMPKYTRVLGSGVKSHCMLCISDVGNLYDHPSQIVKYHDRCACSAREVWRGGMLWASAQHSLTELDRANLAKVADK